MTPNQELAARADLTIEEVWRRFGAQIGSFVRRRVSDPHRADDIVADILLRIHRSLPTLDDGERLAPWLFRIARNAIIDEYRRAGRDREVLGSVPDDRISSGVGEFEDADRVQKELAGCLRPLLAELSPEYRRAIELTDLDGVTQVAAAEAEGISVSGMKSRVQRARKQLATLLNRCCVLTLDARGMPMDYAPSQGCKRGNHADQPNRSCGCGEQL